MKRYLDPVFDKIKLIEDVKFADYCIEAAKSLPLCADIYMPDGDREIKRRALVLIHGGGFVSGDKKQAYIVTLARFFTRLGYVCISPDYHLHAKENRPSYKEAALNTVADIEALYEFLQKNADEYGIDRDNIALGGGSAGGMLANEICKKPDAYRALICLWGAPQSVTDPEKYTPSLLVHGTADRLVNYNLSVNLLCELRNSGVHAELITLEGAGHTAIDRRDEYLPRAVEFLDEYMK